MAGAKAQDCLPFSLTLVDTVTVRLTTMARPWRTAGRLQTHPSLTPLGQKVCLSQDLYASSNFTKMGRCECRDRPVEETWQGEAPITSLRGPHTHMWALQGAGPREGSLDQCGRKYPHLSACLSTAGPHISQSTSHVPEVIKLLQVPPAFCLAQSWPARWQEAWKAKTRCSFWQHLLGAPLAQLCTQ